MRELLYGRNPVYESLRAGRRTFFGLKIAEGVKASPDIARILDLAEARGLSLQWVPRDQIERISPAAQGIILEAGEYPYVNVDDMLATAAARAEAPFLLVLDSLQDPQNLGTLIRTAEAVGLHGLLIPPRQAARVTPAVVSASAGAAEHMAVAQVNLAAALRDLKKAGLWAVGLDHGAESRTAAEIDLSGPLAVVVGSEGQGMRRLVRESCDLLMRLPMVGQIESMNAAVAGSIALYKAFEARSPG